MSRTINSLNAAERKRFIKNDNSANPSKLGDRNPALDSWANQPEPEPGPQISNAYTPWIVSLIIFILLLVNLGISLKLLVTVGNYPNEKQDIISKLDNMDKSATDTSKQIDAFTVSLKEIKDSVDSIDRQAKDNNTKIAQIEEQSSVQSEAIDNFAKTGNELAQKINALKSELEDLKNSSAPNKN